MRFSIEYFDAKTKETNRESISLLNSFLNFHLIETFHGWSYECLFIKLINNAPPRKKWKVSRSYEQWGNVEMAFDPNNKTGVEEFNYGFAEVKHAVDLASTSEIKGLADFRYKELLSDLTNLEQMLPKSHEAYDELLNQKSAMDSQLQVRRVNGRIKAYKDYPMPHSRRLVHMRIYDHFDNAELMPYRYIYAEIFGTLLRNANILTPGYQEIYFSVNETLEAAKRELAFEKWHKYTYCTINIDQYRKATPGQKNKCCLIH
jgi:hypothetical protein